MNIEELRKIVNNIQYKPNVRFMVRETMYPTHWAITTQLPVSLAPQTGEEYIKRFKSDGNYIDGNYFLSKIECDTLTEEQLVEKIFESIRDTEIHEMKEWFLYKNIKIYNPHKDKSEHDADKRLAFCSDTDVGV